LIDSSVFIAAERGDPPLQAALALMRPYEDCFLSAVTVGEVLHGVYRAKDQATRNRREAWVEGILGEIPVLPYDERVARVLAPLDAQLQASGNRIATADLIIVATALTHDHSVLTRDAKSFPKIPGLKHHVI
jgi:predicted nucleic acid-binding protein